ncbi:hypothetical protein [Pollutimonas harenae]|uniref:6-phosphogluconate dehydrogenase NADP-binding domain-containing protein n=1 Tax=Pollutimonas harenae TaxID=657015 RepID=A0A853GQ84_9BURK|nr:hypothetical protein [Pollutimonas harenae]NYT85208.1 hypothetical protein [Pollutimonas harenae]
MSMKQAALYGLGNMAYLVAERIPKHFSLQVADLDKTSLVKAQSALGVMIMRP